MKTTLTLFLALVLTAAIFVQTANAQVTVTGSAGSADGTYTTLKLAFDALNAVTATQNGKNIVVTITASTTETAAAALNYPKIGAWTSLKIYPTSAGLSISGSLATPLIDLNGADNVTIDGRVNQAGVKDLVISNTSVSATASTSTIRFISDATNNTVKNCIIKGSTMAPTGGILFFYSGLTYGNDGNTIDNNDITSCTDANRPLNAIFSQGSATLQENSGNTISNNNIYDFFNRATASYGIYLNTFNLNWTISGNSFYETVSFAPTAAVEYRVINIANTYGTNFIVSNNYIGGSAASCGGVNAWRKTNGSYNTFYGIYINAGTASASNVQGNTIANIDYSNSSTAATWYGIWASGNVNIGTTAANVIGSATGTGSVKFNAGANNTAFNGLYLSAFAGIAQNNTVASITASNTTAGNATNFNGIYVTGISPCTIAGNTIGSTTVGNSINAISVATASPQTVYGIYSDASSTLTISGNTIANLTNGTTGSSAGRINGICVTNGSNVIINNIVRDLSIANSNTAVNSTASVGGIILNYSTAGKVQTITGNTVYNLSNTYATFAGAVAGLHYSGSVTPATVSGNFIHSLSVTGASSTTANLYGINIGSGAATYSNNIINLGGNTLTTIYGIYETGAASNNNNLYFNTVYIGGTPASGTNKSYALYSAVSTNTRDFRNNIFSNIRSTAGGASLHYPMYIVTTVGTLNCNYNDYFVSGTGSKLGYYGGDKTALPIVTGQDANSLATDPSFAIAGGTNPLDYYPSATITGVAGTGILADYSNYTRATPTMGAVEFITAPVPSGNSVDVYNGLTLQASYPDIKNAFAKINDGTHTGSIIVKITGSQTLSSSAVLNASGSGSANYTDVTMFPTTADLTISGNGNFTEPLIDLNGSDNVVIDGRVDATGSTKSLTITNPGIAGSTIRFINDASGNFVKYCILKGSSTNPIGGVICFGTTSGTTGNDGNTIDNNNITNALDAKRPVNAVFSLGAGTGNENSGNIISNNNFYDFLNRGISSYGINLSTYSSAWTITGNSFYETASFVPAVEVEYRLININNSPNGQNFTISNNFFGGNTASCGGTPWTKTNAFSNTFYGIYMAAGVTTASNIQGNTMKNFAYANAGTAADWNGIYIYQGAVNVGNTAGNTIGAATGNGSITFTCGGSGSNFRGIFTSYQTIIQNNTIGSITVANSNSIHGSTFIGIYTAGSNTISIKNNIIGSTDVGTTNSIYASSLASSNMQNIFGMYLSGSGLTTIAGNTVSKMTNATTHTSLGLIQGIYINNGSNVITNNIVRDITISNAVSSISAVVSVCGIVFNITTAGYVQNITGNTIYGLSNTYPSFTGGVIGIYYLGSTTASTVSGNFIHSLSVTGASSTTANLYGIYIAGGAATYSNNIINLGGNTLTNMYGIYETGAASNNNNLYFNTVYIGGTPASGTNKSYALYSAVTTNTRDFRNNIFSNVRSTTGGSSLHYAAWFNYAVSTNLTLDNNDYYAPGIGGVLGRYNNLDVNGIPLISGIDANSLAIDPSFATPGGIAALDYYPSATLPGVSGTGTLADFNEYIRNATTPKMGAIESASAGNSVDLYIGGTLQASFPNIRNAFDKINDGTYTGAIVLKITGSQDLATTAILSGNGVGSANYTSVTMYPTVSGVIISGNIPAPLIDLNGADNVTIDGRVEAAGAAKDMVITNRNASTQYETSTIRFINGATGNTVKYCTIKGSANVPAIFSGIIYFAITSFPTGNSNNLIDNNNITSAVDANRPYYAISSNGTVGSENSGNTISNNNIFDFLNRGSNATYGINFSTGTNACAITRNSFYETTPLVPTGAGAHNIIFIAGTSVANVTISNNYIGGSAPDCSGSPWTKSNAKDNIFRAIIMGSLSIAPSIQGNTIQNFEYSNSLNANWTAISTYSNSNITGNVIGSTTGNGSIKVTNSTTGGIVYGINTNNGSNIDVSNNKIGSITVANTLSTASTNFYGIYLNGGYTSATISNNTIGSTDAGTTNSINSTSLSTGNVQSVYGIYISRPGPVTITGNTISKLTNGTTNTAGFLYGIYNQTSIGSTISNNFINTLLVAGTTTAPVYGINVNGGIGTYANNIISLGGATATTIYGIFETGAAGSENKMYFNTVYIGGSLGSGIANKSYALYSSVLTNVRDFRNNIFSNERSTSGGASLHYGAYFNYAASTTLTLGNNDYYAPGTGGVLGFYNSADAISLPLITGVDAGSVNIDPSFANAGGTAAIDYFPATTLPGISGTGILTDYAGTARNATPTMGAYEKGFPNLTWTGNTDSDWNTATNWNPEVIPTASYNVTIPSPPTNQPIVNEASTTPAVCYNLTISASAVVTINAGKALTVGGTLTNNAGNTGLVIQSTAAGTGSLLNYTANVAATAQRFIAGWSDANHGWHFLSSPVTNQAISSFHTAGSGNDFYKWDELTNEWINRTATGGGLNGSFETDFFVGRGYMIANSTTSTKSFSGLLNVSDVPQTGFTNTAGKTYRGWHLVGNPFSSPIKWTQGTWVKTNVASYPQIWNESTASYKVLAGSGIIPAQNGFVVYVAEGGGSLTIPADARLHSDSLWYKSSASVNEIVLLARDLKGKTAQESIISFNPEATEDFDMAHDSYFMAGFAPMFYSISQNGLYALNTLPELKSEMVIPMGFVKNQSTDFSIELTQNIPGQTLYLIDLKTNNEHKISESPYGFTSVNGDNPNRFLLKFGTTGIGDTPTTPQINAWVYNNMLYVSNPDGNTKIEVFNLNGQCLLNRELFGLGVQSMPLHQPTGLYLIRLTDKGKTITIKANILMN